MRGECDKGQPLITGGQPLTRYRRENEGPATLWARTQVSGRTLPRYASSFTGYHRAAPGLIGVGHRQWARSKTYPEASFRGFYSATGGEMPHLHSRNRVICD